MCSLLFNNLMWIIFIYALITSSGLTFSANWNIFKSPLGSICWAIGLVCALVFWGKFMHWSSTPIIETRNRTTGELIKREENFDISEQMLSKILMPFIGHFIIEPLVYGALIYYPLQCIIAIVGTIFPYVLALLVLVVIATAWLVPDLFKGRYRYWLLVVFGIVFTVGFGWGGYAFISARPGSTIHMIADSSSHTNEVQQYLSGQISGGNHINVDSEKDEAFVFDEDESIEQFEGGGEEGLYGSLPVGTTCYVGDMAGYPIEFDITKNFSTGELSAKYTNIKYNAKMDFIGESLPTMGGDIDFYSTDSQGNMWVFKLTGNYNAITGKGIGDGKELKISLQNSTQAE